MVVAGEVGPEPGLLGWYDGFLFTVSEDLSEQELLVDLGHV